MLEVRRAGARTRRSILRLRCALRWFPRLPARYLLGGLASKDLLASTLGLGTANALLAGAPPAPHMREGDVLQALELRDGDRVCMVGCFVPVMACLQTRGISVTAVDQVPKPGSLPAEEAEKLLPCSQVAIITATSLINGSLDRILDLGRHCREVALLGPSTPLLPEAFLGTPVTCLAGIRVQEADAVLQCVAEGHGFRIFKQNVRKVSIRTARQETASPRAAKGRIVSPQGTGL